MSILTGRTNTYHLTEQVPVKGPMGELWKGVRETDRLPVAVKYMKRWHPGLPEVWQKLADSPHGSRVPILDFFEFRGALCVVRPWLEGTDWKTVLKTPMLYRKLSRETWIKSAMHLLAGLDDLHQIGVVHRDIKPSNLFFVHDANEPADQWNPHRVVLMDLEQACVFPDCSGVRSPFSMLYSPPEMLLQYSHLVDPRADLFALGITLYHVLAGRPPYEDCNAEVVINLQLTYPLKRPSGMEEPLFAVLAKAAYKEPFRLPPSRLSTLEVEQILLRGLSCRYPNALEMHNALSEIDLGVRPVRPWYKRFF